jgi:hypothetical protein
LRAGGGDHVGGGAAQVGHAQPAGEPGDLLERVGPRRGDGRADGDAAGAAVAGGHLAASPVEWRVVPSRAHAAVPGREAVRLGRPGRLAGRAGELVGQDRQQVAVAEAARQRRGAQRLVDHAGAVELGQRDGLGHLAAHPASAGRGGLDQPGAGAVADGEERLLGRGLGPGGPLAWWPGALRVVLVGQHGVAALPTPVPGDLPWPVLVDHDHDDLVAGVADPHPLDRLDQLVGDRVAHPAEGDGAVPADRAGLPERHRDRLGRQRVQPGAFLGKQLGWRPAGHPVRPGVDQLAEPRARRFQLGEAVVAIAQVDLGGDQVPLGDAHGRLRAALGLRVGRHAGADRQPVVPPRGHDVGVAHRHPRDVLDGDGLLVVGQRVGRHPAQPPQRGVQAAQHAGQRPVRRRQHDPEPRPRQPGAPQPHRPAADPRSGAPVELQPQPRLGHPGAEHPPVPRPVAALDRRDRPPGGPLRPRVAHCGQLVVGYVGADPPG